MTNVNSSETNGIPLLPCPFCGAKVEVIMDGKRTWGLIEHRDGCLFPVFPKHELAECDFKKWNTRAAVVDVTRFCEVSGL